MLNLQLGSGLACSKVSGPSVLLLAEIVVRPTRETPPAIPATVWGQQQHRLNYVRPTAGNFNGIVIFLLNPKIYFLRSLLSYEVKIGHPTFGHYSTSTAHGMTLSCVLMP